MSRLLRVLSPLCGLAGVALGAYAAHGIADPRAAAAVGEAALYLLIHAAALAGLGPGAGLLGRLGRWGLLVGVILFAGGITLGHLGPWPPALHLAPVGGTLLMLGWLLLAVTAIGRG